MESRDRILKRVQLNQPPQCAKASAFNSPPQDFPEGVEKFKETLKAIGGTFFEINTLGEIRTYINNLFPNRKREVIYLPGYEEPEFDSAQNGKDFENVDLAVLKGEFAVAENAAIWITEKNMLDRSLPFISEHLILVIDTKILPTLHEAYQRIKTMEYQFGTFIAGPSKTADIEQSLVLGAHGPKTLTVLLVRN